MTTATRRWTRRLTRTVTAGTAGGVLLLGAPLGAGAPAAAEVNSTVEPATTSIALVSATRHAAGRDRAVVVYRVRRGDTATGLAVRFHAWTRELRALNHLGRRGTLLVGQRLRIPVVVSAARRARAHRRAVHPRAHHRAHHRAAPRRPHRAVHRAAHRRPTRWQGADATRSQVRRVVVRTARRHAVDPRLMLAIAWQESGWQQRRRSSAGAIGVMQVLPGTARWMSSYAGRRLDAYALRDNVSAGVLLFKVLRGETSRRRAVAAYYQGLGSVRSRGLYPSTRRYTRSVAALHRRLAHGWSPA